MQYCLHPHPPNEFKQIAGNVIKHTMVIQNTTIFSVLKTVQIMNLSFTCPFSFSSWMFLVFSAVCRSLGHMQSHLSIGIQIENTFSMVEIS